MPIRYFVCYRLHVEHDIADLSTSPTKFTVRSEIMTGPVTIAGWLFIRLFI